jgi:hypothetical protein
VVGTDARLAAAALGNTLTRAGPIKDTIVSHGLDWQSRGEAKTRTEGHSHAAVEVHTVDTDTRVVLDTEVDVLADTEAEVAGLGEVLLSQLVFLDLEATLEDLLGLGATDGNVDGNLFVTTDTEGTDSVASLAYS